MPANPQDDREEIRATLRRYARAIDRGDMALLGGVFVPGAKVHYGTVAAGAYEYPDVCEFLGGVLALHRATQHVLSNYEIELRGDEALAETYLTATHEQVDGEGDSHVTVLGGIYHDELRRTDEGWRIRSRDLETLYVTGRFLGPDRARTFPLPRSRRSGG